MKPTAYQNVNKLLDELLSKMQDILGGNFAGLYLYGSLAISDFDENVSDIDLLAILELPINDEIFLRLQKMHHDFVNEHKDWNDRIEVQYWKCCRKIERLAKPRGRNYLFKFS